MSPFALTADLPECLEFEGEFGAEVNSFIPFVHWLHLAGLMGGRRVRTYAGMGPFYFFLGQEQIEETSRPRRFVSPARRPGWLPTRDDHASVRTAFEAFPDYRGHYRGGLLGAAAGRELLVVHNKFTPEWDGPPVNFLPLDLLADIFGGLGKRFQIVYLRPGLRGTPPGYSADHQPDLAYGDAALLDRFPEVEAFDDIAEALSGTMSYNEAKLRLYAETRRHITVQGGNAHLLSLFSGGLVAIYHRAGQELRHAYARGHFAYAASPPPSWLICRDPGDLRQCLPLFASAEMVDGQAVAPATHADLMRALSPGSAASHGVIVPPEIDQPLMDGALAHRHDLAEQHAVGADFGDLDDAAVERHGGFAEHRGAGFQHVPGGGGEARLGVALDLAAEQRGQRLLVGAQRVHAQHPVGDDDGVRIAGAIDAHQQRRRLIGDAADGRSGEAAAAGDPVAGDHVHRGAKPRHGVPIG